MRMGVLSRAAFAVAFLAVFTAMAVEAPKAKSQVGGYFQRMTFMHQNAQLHFSTLDTTLAPSPGAPTVGKFIQATGQSSQLIEGQTYPSPLNPEYMYGFTKDGTNLRTVGVTGTPIQSIDFSDTFSRINGAWLFTNQVAAFPFNSVPSCYDLVPHYAMVGEINQANPSLQGNSTGIILVNPATMAGFKVGATGQFFGDSSTTKFEDICCCVYPGLDGDYATAADNEYRYVMGLVLTGSGLGGMGCLSLNFDETMNGKSPPDPFNPVEPTRGPDFTNVYPRVNANSKWGTTSIGGVVDNGQVYMRSWYARPGIPGFANTEDRSYVAMGSVIEIPGTPTRWRPRFCTFSMGLDSVTSLPTLVFYTGADPNWHAFCKPYLTSDIFKSMVVVGDWCFCTTGDGINGDGFGDQIEMIYLPEACDGLPDDGHRGSWSPLTTSAGYAGGFYDTNRVATIVYFGTGSGTSSAFGTIRSPYQDWGPNIAGAGSGLTPIDFHTEEEKLLGLNVRQAPQPFTGYYQTEDPASNFPGSIYGKGKGSDSAGACHGSSSGGGASIAALAGLLAMAGLLVKTLRA